MTITTTPTPIDNILKEIDENKVQILELNPDDALQQEPQKVSVDLLTRKNIIREYLEGADKRDLGNKYNLSTRAISLIVEGNTEIRLETEKKFLATSLARENYRLSETKNKILNYIDSTLDEVLDDPVSMTTEAKMKVLNNIATLFDKLAITSRLNQDKPTNINETRELKVDLDKVLAQLPTPEDKLNFLRNQNTSSRINQSIYEGQVVTTE